MTRSSHRSSCSSPSDGFGTRWNAYTEEATELGRCDMTDRSMSRIGWTARAAVAVTALALGLAAAPTAAAAAPSGFVIVQATTSVPANGAAFPDLSCPAGKTAISGGFERTDNLIIAESHPLSSQWHVAAWNPTATAGTVTVFAVCAEVEVSG